MTGGDTDSHCISREPQVHGFDFCYLSMQRRSRRERRIASRRWDFDNVPATLARPEQAVADASSLIANIVMAWNTAQMQKVVDHWNQEPSRKVPPDLRGQTQSPVKWGGFPSQAAIGAATASTRPALGPATRPMR